MKRLAGFLLGLSIVLGGVSLCAAQEKSGPPKVLTIFREFVKPGKAGMVHEKAESAFVQAFTKASWPTHYLAVTSLSGKPRALFLIGYDSFAAWEKDNQATEKNATLSAALDRAGMADGELLSGVDGGTFVYREDQSLRAGTVHIAHMRYFEISAFHVKPGHEKDWDEAVKLVTAAYEKIPDVRWATFEAVYGAPSGTFIIFTPMKSLAEVDTELMQNKQFEAAMGEEGMKKLRELSAKAIESSESNLFQFAPKMSYVEDDWVKKDPDYWRPKAAKPAGEKKAEKKPAKKQ
ncbi:MAG TPA: hypothetical protein VMT05_03235 [Terriglobales bacterium]|jgi:hypothetical protein|nr:hypothetical protein [Terriglobales bacterium]